MQKFYLLTIMRTTTMHHEYSYIVLRKYTYYYSRRVPLDMRGQYKSQRIVVSLRTHSKRAALRGSQQVSIQLENHWSAIRVQQITNSIIRKTRKPQLSVDFDGCGFDLLDAQDHYLRLKGHDKSAIFHRIAQRNIEYAIDVIGNKDLAEYTTTDGASFRDALLARGLTVSSVKRIFSSVRSIVNLTLKEHGLQATNPFAGTYMPEEVNTKKRTPFPEDSLIKIQKLCRRHDDDLRWLVSLISDTGMRLGEACGLKVSDIELNADIPCVHIRPNEARRLKTSSSERTIPLVGEALWAVSRAVKHSTGEFLFPRYTKQSKANANSASAALNKWLRGHAPEGCVVHSFRHSMRDRLRAIECAKDIVDQIGGWSAGSVGENYGDGYPIMVLNKWLELATSQSKQPSGSHDS